MSSDAVPPTEGAFEAKDAGGEARRPELAAAVALGWRVAELYARVDDPGASLGRTDTMLPSHGSLSPDDQLELQLHAAAGDARRAGIAVREDLLANLARCAQGASSSPERTERFREEVARYHVELSKELWARHEASGKAYELGNGLSDTYGRICRSYRSGDGDAREAWIAVFDRGRIERLKKLLDDLESRLDSAGVAVVRDQLDVWRDRVEQWTRASGPLPPENVVREKLRRQTVTWRQLTAGDKAPEAYLNGEARAELRGDLRRLVWKRARRFVFPAAGVLLLLALSLPALIDWFGHRELIDWGTASAVVAAVTGALGITKASMLAAVRTQAHQWSELLWGRAVVAKVSERTLVVEGVLPVSAPPARAGVRAARLRRMRLPLRLLRSAG